MLSALRRPEGRVSIFTEEGDSLRTKQWSIDIAVSPRGMGVLGVVSGNGASWPVGMQAASTTWWVVVARVSWVPAMVGEAVRFQKL